MERTGGQGEGGEEESRKLRGRGLGTSQSAQSAGG